MLRISKKKSKLNTKQEEIRRFHFRAHTKEILNRIIIIITTKPKTDYLNRSIKRKKLISTWISQNIKEVDTNDQFHK